MILKTYNLVKDYNSRRVVNRLNLEVSPGEVVGLLGPNGAGKTSTFYMIVGMTRPTKGEVFLGDENITNLPMYVRARKGISYLSQEPSVFRKLTVEDNLMAILETQNLTKEDREKRLKELLSELNISHLAKNKAYTLSGGERRRLEVTRSLIISPYYILLDEPFTGIDPIAINEIKEIIKNLKNKGIGVLISDHNVRETLEICNRAYILNDGKILEDGEPEKIIRSSKAREIYLGKDFKL
jgi:lipopolysaccharide export system ATP-binding protein